MDRIEAMLAGRSEFPSVAEATPEAPPPVTTPPVSVLWAAYAAGLAALGFVRRLAAVRWAALALFALTIIKAMLVDIAQLQQLYRIIVFFVLGVLLLLVAWRYHKAFHASQPDSSV